MFLAAIIPLRATTTPPPHVVPFMGRAGHAVFLDLLKAVNAQLAEELHQGRALKPFTVSGIVNPRARFETTPEICAGGVYEFRITAYRADVAECVLNDVLPHLSPTLRFGSVYFETNTPIIDSATHPWAGTTTADALVNAWYHAVRTVPREIKLQFASPTTYRHIHRNMLVPLPVGLFPGYLDAWNRNAAPRFDPNLTARVAGDVVISRYRLETRNFANGEYHERGWLGECEYAILSEEPALARLLQLLADFTLYCGTGYKTTQGMGQTRKM